MPSHADLARRKSLHIRQQIDALQTAQRAMPQVGGLGFRLASEQITFQQWRMRLLERAEAAPEMLVRNWLASTLSTLTAAELACIAGDARGLRPEAYRAIVAAELYQVALGEHRGQKGAR